MEVEYYNRDDVYTTPNVYFMTQVIKTDKNPRLYVLRPLAGLVGFCGPERQTGKKWSIRAHSRMWSWGR